MKTQGFISKSRRYELRIFIISTKTNESKLENYPHYLFRTFIHPSTFIYLFILNHSNCTLDLNSKQLIIHFQSGPLFKVEKLDINLPNKNSLMLSYQIKKKERLHPALVRGVNENGEFLTK